MQKNILIVGGIIIIIGVLAGVVMLGKKMTPSENSANTEVTPTVTQTTLANPASVNCKKVGGTTQIMDGPNGQYGLCNFDDAYACEEWALFRGECPVGGVRTTGFDTIEQKYCAWSGGQTLAVPNAQCTFKNGKVCLDTEFYEGTCAQN